MKKFLLLIIALFISTTFILAGCGNNGLPENPPADTASFSNGGIAVTKGDYLYYVNGFKSYEGLTKDVDNVWGDQVIGSIYRVKLNDNKIAHNADGFLEKSEVVVPQIVGTENACFYIFGDYIYYATPNMQVDEHGNLLNSRSNICRVNINGTNNKVLYTTDQTLASLNWTMYELDGTVYVVMLDGQKLLSINANAKKPGVTVMANKVTSAGLIQTDKHIPTDTVSTSTINGVNNYIYYTRDITADDQLGTLGGNFLARVKLGTSSEEKVATNGNTYTITEVKNGCLYYSKTEKGSSIPVVCKYVLSNDKTLNESRETEISYASYTHTFMLNANNENYVGSDMVAIDSSNNIVLVSVVNKTKTIKTLYTGSTAVVPAGLYGSKLFFFEDTSIKYIDVTAQNPVAYKVEINGKSIKVNSNDTKNQVVFDYDGRNVYYYASYTPANGSEANFYLNRTDLEASEQKSEFVGVFANGHTPEQPEADEDQDPTNDIPWIS